MSTLYSLVRELGLGMGDLFSTEPADRIVPPTASPLVTPDARALINLESGVTWERLTATADPGVEFLRVVYNIGSESCPAGLAHPPRRQGIRLPDRRPARHPNRL